LTKHVNTKIFKMDNLGEIIRKLRVEKKMPLRTVATYLDIDQAILSKIERGLRTPVRELVVKLAAYFNVDKDLLLVAWLSDKLVFEVGDEPLAVKALQMAEEKVAYQKQNPAIALMQSEQSRICSRTLQYFQTQSKVTKAWLFGSFARGENSALSDVDILIDVPPEIKFTLFDIAEVKEQLQKILNRKVDVIMLNGLKSGIKERVINDMQLIYEA
jgi:predicted nucleotidyltransferase/DNA-binding XRE family transcriptional regulator